MSGSERATQAWLMAAKIRRQARTMVRLEMAARAAQKAGYLAEADELWKRRNQVRSLRSETLRGLWAQRRARYEAPYEAAV